MMCRSRTVGPRLTDRSALAMVRAWLLKLVRFAFTFSGFMLSETFLNHVNTPVSDENGPVSRFGIADAHIGQVADEE